MNTPIVHVLTTEKRSDRHTSLIRQSIEQGFAVNFFFGEKSENRVDTKKFICQGHKRIIRYAKKNNLPFICIAEDDLVFPAPGAYKYFIDNIPGDYDLWMAVIYHGEIEPETYRVLNGFSGGMTLYCVHHRFYDFILNDVPDDCHIDRELGNTCHKHKYFMCNPIAAAQSGGYSDNLKQIMYYDVYLEGRAVYGKDGQ